MSAHEPQVQQRAVQPYVAIRRAVTNGVPQAVDAAFPQLFAWLSEHGVAPTGPPFIRFLLVDDAGEPLELEVAAPVDGAVATSDPLRADVLPAGRYATVRHVGPYRSATEPDLAAARARLQAWADERGLVYGRRTDRGKELPAYVERYFVGPMEEPDYSKWETELAYLIT
jgi:effector-binding domain-containing protein